MDMQGIFRFARRQPLFLVTGRTLSDQTCSFSLVPKSGLHASCVLAGGLSIKKAESYYCNVLYLPKSVSHRMKLYIAAR